MNPKRLDRFDLLKAIAMVCIMAAHAGFPTPIHALRNFDVPLLVLISGALFQYGFEAKSICVTAYIRHRIERLLVPTWIFLVCLFLSGGMLAYFTGREIPFSPVTLQDSFLLLLRDGIGYIWIIRVFLLVAAAAPLLLMGKRRAGTRLFALSLILIYGLYEVLFSRFGGFEIPLWDDLMREWLFYLLPYGCVFGLGMMLREMKRKEVLVTSLVFAFLFFACFVRLLRPEAAGMLTAQDFKYPPRLYYLSYGISASLLLYFLTDSWVSAGKWYDRAVLFLSRRSLRIYLWHAGVLTFRAWFFPECPLGAVGLFLLITILPALLTLAHDRVEDFVRTRLLSQQGPAEA